MVPFSRAPSWAALSIPRASPETTTRSCWPRSWARPRAKRQAAADALRAPTIATAVRSSRLRLPLAIISGGASSASASNRGYIPCPSTKYLAPSFSTRAISRSASERSNSRGALPPPRRARSGTASRAAPALPNRRINCRKVTGPIPGVRTSLSRSTRSSFKPWLSQCVARSRPSGEGCFRGASKGSATQNRAALGRAVSEE